MQGRLLCLRLSYVCVEEEGVSKAALTNAFTHSYVLMFSFLSVKILMILTSNELGKKKKCVYPLINIA